MQAAEKLLLPLASTSHSRGGHAERVAMLEARWMTKPIHTKRVSACTAVLPCSHFTLVFRSQGVWFGDLLGGTRTSIRTGLVWLIPGGLLCSSEISRPIAWGQRWLGNAVLLCFVQICAGCHQELQFPAVLTAKAPLICLVKYGCTFRTGLASRVSQCCARCRQ